MSRALTFAFAVACTFAGAGAASADALDGEGYTIAVSTPAECRPGAAVTATVAVRPRGGWKLNTDYPFKLELAPAAGVKVAKPVMKKPDTKRFAESGVDVEVVITADKAGPADVAATVKFATCDDAQCAVHKVAFTIAATAK